jgi:hypothetical protein
MSKKRQAEVEARLKEFWDDHKDFDSGWARNILEQLTEVILPIVFKSSALEIGLEQLYVKSGVRVPRELLEQQVKTGVRVPREHLEQYVKTGLVPPRELDLEKLDLEFDFMLDEPDGLPVAVLSPLPIFKYALALSAYADYGLILQFPKEDEISGENIFDFILDRLDRFPRHWVNDRIIIAAQAREKLDQNESVTPDELAALARVSRKSIMNLAAPGKGGVVLQKSSDDQITSESAMRWLLSRPDFRRSIWQQQKNLRISSRYLPKQAAPSIVEPLFIPVAGDGSWFSPAERHQPDGHYQVGNGDDEKQFDDYWVALDFLARAASPRWRYADTTGRWRIRMATGWERKARREVEKLLAEQMESKNINHKRKA